MPLVSTLIIIGWKRSTLLANAHVCGLPSGIGFRIRFYLNAALDLLRFLHGQYGSPILTRSRDAAKIERLRTGPSLLLTAHFHNWELMGGWLVRQGVPLLSAARPMVHGYSQRLLVRLRDRLGQRVLFDSAPRRALRHLQSGGCFGFIWDQRVPASKTRAPLFSRTLAMDPLPRFLIRNSGAPVFFGVLLPGGAFRILQIAGPRVAPFPQVTSRSATRSFIHPSLGSIPESLNPSLLFTPPLPSSSTLTCSDSTQEGERYPSPLSSQDPRDTLELGPDGNDGSDQFTGSEKTDRLGRRYHRILECLIRAHPTSWYGLAHRRFLD